MGVAEDREPDEHVDGGQTPSDQHQLHHSLDDLVAGELGDQVV